MILNVRRWVYISTATMVVNAIIVVTFPPAFGLDFTGGSLLEVIPVSDRVANIGPAVEAVLSTPVSVQPTQAGTALIKMPSLDEVRHRLVIERLRQDSLIEEELRFESIGPSIGAELRRKAWWAVGLAVVVMIGYLAYEFRTAAGLVRPWMFGMAAAWALVHDLLIVTALFAVLSRWSTATIDTLFLTALLAVFGYSINDTIVLFNRVKSEWLATRAGHLPSVLDAAARGTVIRSLNTSLTTLAVLVSLFVFGGSTLRWFVVALTAGVITGSYSSLFVAPPFLYVLTRWHR